MVKKVHTVKNWVHGQISVFYFKILQAYIAIGKHILRYQSKEKFAWICNLHLTTYLYSQEYIKNLNFLMLTLLFCEIMIFKQHMGWSIMWERSNVSSKPQRAIILWNGFYLCMNIIARTFTSESKKFH